MKNGTNYDYERMAFSRYNQADTGRPGMAMVGKSAGETVIEIFLLELGKLPPGKNEFGGR